MVTPPAVMNHFRSMNGVMPATEAVRVKPRAEFRVFGHGLIKAVQERMWMAGAVLHMARQMPEEVYLLSRHTDGANVKVREGLLDVKLRTGDTAEGYEIYQPWGKFRFPLASADLKETLGHLRVEMALGGESCAYDKFLMLARAHPDLTVVSVEKIRYGFSVQGVICEYAKVMFNGALMETACCESDDHAALTRAIAVLGLAAMPNTSYTRAAMRVVGMIAYGPPLYAPPALEARA